MTSSSSAWLGRGFQLVDPDPPFDAARHDVPLHIDRPPFAPEPDDAELEAWAAEGRILSTLLNWFSGWSASSNACLELIDLAAATGLRAGLMLTAPTIELAGPFLLRSLHRSIEAASSSCWSHFWQAPGRASAPKR